MKDSKDNFGTRMKEIEAHETSRVFLRGLPIYVRIDGRGFSKFTKGMKRPYDERMSFLMMDTAKYLIKETHAIFGFCQSDEISLVYFIDNKDSDIFFNRKITKLTSVLASMASSYFCANILNFFDIETIKYQFKYPHFDARVIQMPSKEETANMVLWRAMDATKNAVSMAAHTYFSHKSLQGINSAQMQERLFQEKGINFNDYPNFFKAGSFLQRKTTVSFLPEDILSKMSEEQRENASKGVKRTIISDLNIKFFNKVVNRTSVIFDGEEPLYEEKSFDKT